MMKIIFKVLGVLIILAIGLSFMFYGKSNEASAKAEKAYKHGDFETAAVLYEKGILDLEKWPLLKDAQSIVLARVWALYYQGYYDPEEYKLAEEIVARELQKEKSIYKDQLYNLKALISWQKGVELFIEKGKQAANSKELDEFLDEAIASSGEAVKANDGWDWNIKYNYEFFRLPKDKLKKQMQLQANQKQKNREMKKKMEQMAKEKKIQPNPKEGQPKQGKGEQKTEKEKSKMKTFVPGKKKGESEKEEQPGTTKEKKKKKG